MQKFIVRQPILDRSERVYGYELLFRRLEHGQARLILVSSSDRRATLCASPRPAQYIVEALHHLGPPKTRVTQVAERSRLHISLNEKYWGWYQSIGPAVTLVTVRR